MKSIIEKGYTHCYPKLMVSRKDDELVILMFKEDKIKNLGIGTVVKCADNESCYTLGYISNEWHLKGFIDFVGKIKLLND